MPRRKQTRDTTVFTLTTVPNPGVILEQSPQPAIGIHVMPTGPRFLFQEADGHALPRQYIVIGTSRRCHVRLRDPAVSAFHCAIVRRKDRVDVRDLGSTNGLWIAGYRVPSCELHAGTLITIGNTRIAAIGQEHADHHIIMPVATLPELLRRAVDVYGSVRAAAVGIGIPASTLRDWLRTK